MGFSSGSETWNQTEPTELLSCSDFTPGYYNSYHHQRQCPKGNLFAPKVISLLVHVCTTIKFRSNEWITVRSFPICFVFLYISLTYFWSNESWETIYTWRSGGWENWPCFSATQCRIGTPNSSWGRSQQVIILLLSVQSKLEVFCVYLLAYYPLIYRWYGKYEHLVYPSLKGKQWTTTKIIQFLWEWNHGDQHLP